MSISSLGTSWHRSAGDYQGNLHYAAMRQPFYCQILWKLLQEHGSLG